MLCDADLVLRVRDDRGRLSCALVVEVQLSRNESKSRTWALYAAWAHDRLRCPVHVIVIAVDDSVARWAAGPFRIGDMTLRPWVIGPEDFEPVTVLADARRCPELTFLSGLAHRNDPVAADVGRALWYALNHSQLEHASLIWDIYMQSIDATARRSIEMSFESYVPVSDWGKGFYRKGIAEGRRDAEAKALLRLLGVRRIPLAPEQRQRIRACDDFKQLRAWFRRAATASSAAEVFGDA